MKPNEILDEAAKTFADRDKQYGNNYLVIGEALAALLPNGIALKTPEDFNRFHLWLMALAKLSRYGKNLASGGQQDSIRDACVYSAILEAFDSDQ
ncbi:MAG: hypothetical protein NTV32_10645 [Gammaproteobacteria bacterium]|nr:hypothetical protein [Gammaproteobacteria bacterium]